MEIALLLQRLDDCPPFLVYYCSGYKTGQRPNIRTIAKSSGLSYRTIMRISGQTSWQGIRLNSIVAFCGACGVDPLNCQDALEWLASQMEQSERLSAFDSNKGTRSIMVRRFNRLAAWYELALANKKNQGLEIARQSKSNC